MWIPLLAAVVGCITVPVYKEGCPGCDSGWDSGVEASREDGICDGDWDCSSAERCVRGTCECLCTEDADCDGNYACSRPEYDNTDVLGCAQRCQTSQDCKGGTACQWDGSCE
jgi:hypothetical protein